MRNAGFYAAAALAWTLAGAVEATGGAGEGRGCLKRGDGGERPRPRRMRLWRLRRELLALPNRIVGHARELKVSLLGLGESRRQIFKR